MAEGAQPNDDGSHLWMEGQTLVALQADQERPTHMPRGPAKRSGPGFLNPAMAPARTRSVLLLTDAMQHDWLVKAGHDLRALDALCATGVRVRRWRNEIPEDFQERLRISANDLDATALGILEASHERFPPKTRIERKEETDRYDRPPEGRSVNGIFIMQKDARISLMESAYQWIDLDPFGSPVSFLDAAIQGLSRTAFIEVTATDTAALTGSSHSSGQRRYGAKGIVDSYAHDDAVRVLLGLIATTAARHDRCIEPVLALFDGHHVRVSVKVRRSRDGASEVLKSMGWRVRLENGSYRFVHHPEPEQLEVASGPLWIGPLWNAQIAGRMTEAFAIETCFPSEERLAEYRQAGLRWSEADTEYAQRELRRSVRYIADAADLMSRDHVLYHMDDLPNMAGTGQVPKMENLLNGLQQAGFAAARIPDIDPFFVTEAPHERVLEVVRTAAEKKPSAE